MLSAAEISAAVWYLSDLWFSCVVGLLRVLGQSNSTDNCTFHSCNPALRFYRARKSMAQFCAWSNFCLDTLGRKAISWLLCTLLLEVFWFSFLYLFWWASGSSLQKLLNWKGLVLKILVLTKLLFFFLGLDVLGALDKTNKQHVIDYIYSLQVVPDKLNPGLRRYNFAFILAILKDGMTRFSSPSRSERCMMTSLVVI